VIYHVAVGDQTHVIEIRGQEILVDRKPCEVDFAQLGRGPVRSLIVDGVSHRISASRIGPESWDLHLSGRRIRAEAVDERTRAIREMTGAGSGPVGPRPIVAPMPGMVVRIEVSEGDTIRAGQGVVIVEAMKMENELTAEADAVVTKVMVAEGQAVEKDQLLVDLAPVEAEEEAD
jgi:acetyl/propionyl-CoA carboxylase alpha subunit